jgi:DNA repair exonuclease SbcCD ATPase subunit
MKWESQREQLFEIAGVLTDEEIAERDTRFKELLDRITNKSLSDYKKEIASKLRKVKDEIKLIQPKIDQTVKLMPEELNFTYIESEIKRLNEVLSNVDSAINDKTEAIRQQYTRAQEKQREVNILKSKRDQIVREANETERARVNKANEHIRELQNDLDIANSQLRTIVQRLTDATSELKSQEELLNTKQYRIETLREDWIKTNAKEYTGNDNCSACGQLLPEEKRSSAREKFAEWKSEELSKIDISGANLKSEIEKIEKQIAEIKEKIAKLEADKIEKQEDLNKIESQLSGLKPTEPGQVIADSLPEWNNLTKQIESLEAEIKEIEAGKGEETEELTARRKVIISEISELESQLKIREDIAKYKNEIADLEKSGKDLESTEFTIKAFVKTKIDDVDKRVNGLFQFVTFKMFDYTIEGDEIETCVPLVKGVPFPVANAAGKINAGLDIIKALQKHYGVLMPIFVDDADLVNEFPEMDNQMIYLRVTNEKRLTIS